MILKLFHCYSRFGEGQNCMVLKHMLHFPARTHLEAEEIAGHSNQRCRRFCFVIIIPYPDRKANICSIYRWKKMSTISRYRLNAERQNDEVLTCRLYGFNMWGTSNQSAMPIAYMGIGTRAHRIITIIPISIVTIKIMHAISILYSSLCSLNAAMRTIALASAIIPIPFHNHESSCITCIGVTSFLKSCRKNMG